MHARLLFTVLLALPGCYGGEDDLSGSESGGSSGAAVVTTSGASTGEGTSGAPTTGDAGESSGEGGSTTGPVTSATETGSESSTGGESGEQSTGTTGDPLEGCPRLRVMVAPSPTLNVRPTPSTELEPVGSVVHGAIVDTVAAVQGEAVEGNTLWYQIVAPAGYVSGQFVACTEDLPPPPPDGYNLPLACGMSAKISQGNNGGTSHSGKTKYAFDFALALNTPMHAMADGTVIHIYDETGPGDLCYDGGGPDCFPYGNLVVLLHGDGSTTLYKHLNEVDVTLGDVVLRGEVVGLSGSTGYSTGPHAHVMRMENCGANNCQSIPLEFIECGVPVQGDTVTSENCP